MYREPFLNLCFRRDKDTRAHRDAERSVTVSCDRAVKKGVPVADAGAKQNKAGNRLQDSPCPL